MNQKTIKDESKIYCHDNVTNKNVNLDLQHCNYKYMSNDKLIENKENLPNINILKNYEMRNNKKTKIDYSNPIVNNEFDFEEQSDESDVSPKRKTSCSNNNELTKQTFNKPKTAPNTNNEVQIESQKEQIIGIENQPTKFISTFKGVHLSEYIETALADIRKAIPNAEVRKPHSQSRMV